MADLINVTPEKLKSTAVSFQQTGQNVKRTTSDASVGEGNQQFYLEW